MPPDLLSKFPAALQQNALPLAVCATLFGAMLWLAGARLSRGLFALAGVTAGGLLGMYLPRWMGWPIDGMATVVGGAIVLGLAGYLLFMTCNGLLFGVMLAAGATLAVWHHFRPDMPTGWALRAINPAASWPSMLAAIWQSFPPPLNRAVPAAIAGGLSTGVISAVLWPRAAAIVAYSILGTAVVLCAGSLAFHLARPTWQPELPASLLGRWSAPVVLVMLGIVAQWRIFPPTAEARRNEEKPGPSSRHFSKTSGSTAADVKVRTASA